MFNCPLLNNSAGECLEKCCKIYGEIIIRDKSLFPFVCFFFENLLISKNLKNKPKINICLCFCSFCHYIISSGINILD